MHTSHAPHYHSKPRNQSSIISDTLPLLAQKSNCSWIAPNIQPSLPFFLILIPHPHSTHHGCKTKQSLTILFPLHHHCRTNLPSLVITIGTLYVMCCTRSLQQRSSQLSRTNEYIKFVFNLKFSKWITFEMIVCSVGSVGRAQVS